LIVKHVYGGYVEYVNLWIKETYLMSDDKDKLVDLKAKPIANILDKVALHLADKRGAGMSRSMALATGKCAGCGEDAGPFRDAVSRKEYSLTAWCQACQDDFWPPSK